jgi:hypothetical protein
MKQIKTMEQLTREIEEIDKTKEILKSMGFEQSDFQTFERDEINQESKMFNYMQVDVVENNLNLFHKEFINRPNKKYYLIFGTHFQVRAWGFLN